MPGNPNWKKGKSGNPKGRPPILLPEVQRALDANKNAVKIKILQKLDPKIDEWLDRVIEQGIGEGCVVRLKTLLELSLGKMVDDTKEESITADERVILEAYRRRRAELGGPGGQGIDEGSK